MKFMNVRRKFYSRPKIVHSLKSLIHDQRGAATWIDVALVIIVSIVLCGLILGGLYLLFSQSLLPTISSKLQDMFNYAG